MDKEDKDLELERIKLTDAHIVSAGHEISQPSILTICPRCERSGLEIKKYRINTAYSDDESNWQESCRDCYVETVDHYNDLWNEYYRSQYPI